MTDRELRGALGQFATGVCLITVDDEQSGQLALTANSFSSVSLDPPLVLWSIQNNSDCYREYTDCGFFGISVLASEHEALSNHYAKKGNHAIDADRFTLDKQGTPLLTNALANFSCATHAVIDAGDHQIIVGRVIDFSTNNGTPLLFYGGKYDRLRATGQAEL